MRVRLAAQILSETVSSVLSSFTGQEYKETANFCLKMDKFFDCTNVRNTKEHLRKGKPHLKPYEKIDDGRFEWLQNEFLPYFSQWKNSIEKRKGKFNAADKAKMFISRQTYEGLQITTYSLVECIKFLLRSGVKYVLSQKFCQDDLENYFGQQRAIGRRRDNPTVYATGYNENIIKSQFSVAPIGSNVLLEAESEWRVSDEPVPKRNRK